MGRGGQRLDGTAAPRRDGITAVEVMAGTIVPGKHAHAPEPDDGKEGGQGPRRIRKTYRCAGFGKSCMVHPQDGQPYPLRHFVRHSPYGFGWGYGGSAAAELARCILIDHLGYTQQAEDGWELPVDYQRFKEEVIAHQPRERPLELSSELIDAWLERVG